MTRMEARMTRVLTTSTRSARPADIMRPPLSLDAD